MFGLGKDVCIAQMIHNSVCSVSSLCTLHGFHFFWTREDEPRCGGRVVGLPWHSLYHAQTVSLCSFFFIPECLQCLIFDVCYLLSTRTELSDSQRVVTKTETASIYETSGSCCDVTATDFIRTFRVILSTSWSDLFNFLFFFKYNFTRCSLSNVRSQIVGLSTHVMYLLKVRKNCNLKKKWYLT